MNNLFFWSSWPKSFRIFFSVLISVFLLLIICCFFTYLLGIGNIVSWETIPQLKPVKVEISRFRTGMLELPVFTDSFLIEERFNPSQIKFKIYPAYGFVIIIFFCSALLTSIFTFLNRIWYLGGMGLVMLFFVLLKLDVLGVFGFYNNYFLIAILTLMLPLSYYFHAFDKQYAFFKRFAVFVLIHALILGLILLFSAEKQPIVFLANYGIAGPALVAVATIIMVSLEIIYGFLVITTQSSLSKTNNIIHFAGLSFIYFASLGYVYLRNVGFFDLGIFNIDIFLILIISLCIGFWGFKKRAEGFSKVLPFYPFGALFYITLCIITLATLSFIFSTFNDPAIEAFEDLVLFSHLGMGLIFFIYTFFNFGRFIAKNQAAYKIVYQARLFPFYVARIVGVISIFGFFARSDFYSFSQATAGYYNGMGEYYRTTGELLYASEYYKAGAFYGYKNHKSNFSLSDIAIRNGKFDIAEDFLKESVIKNPTEQAYIQLANLLADDQRFFESVFTLREAIKKFPKSAEIQNNLGLLYTRTNILDSAYFFMSEAAKKDQSGVAEGNLLSFYIINRQELNLNLDSILANQELNSASAQNNKIVGLTVLNVKDSTKSDISLDYDTLQLKEFAAIYSAGLFKLNARDSAFFKNLKPYDSLAHLPFQENIAFLNCLADYYRGDKKSAMFKIDALQVSSASNAGLLNQYAGIWALENNSPARALEFFNRALEYKNLNVFFYRALAFLELGRKTEAKEALILSAKMYPELTEITSQILTAIAINDFPQASINDNLKALIVQFGSLDFLENLKLANSIETPNFKAVAINILLEDSYELGKYDDVQRIFNENKDLLKSNLIYWEKSFSIYINSQSVLASKEEFKNEMQAYTVEETNFLNYASGKNASAKILELEDDQKAETYYIEAINESPLDAAILENAVNYLNTKNESEQAYQLTFEAIQLNPASIPLTKVYILQSLRMGMNNYAQTGIQDLKLLVDEKEFKDFLVKYQAEKQIIERSFSF